MKHFGGGLRPPPKHHLAVADVFIPSFVATSQTSFGGGRRVRSVSRPPPKRNLAVADVFVVYFAYCLT